MLFYSNAIAQSWITVEIKKSRKCKEPAMWVWIDGKKISGDHVRISKKVSPGNHKIGVQAFCFNSKGKRIMIGSKAKKVKVKTDAHKKIKFKF